MTAHGKRRARSEAVKKYYFLTKGFAGRDVFSPPHMSPEKMIELFFTAPAVKLCEAF